MGVRAGAGAAGIRGCRRADRGGDPNGRGRSRRPPAAGASSRSGDGGQPADPSRGDPAALRGRAWSRFGRARRAGRSSSRTRSRQRLSRAPSFGSTRCQQCSRLAGSSSPRSPSLPRASRPSSISQPLEGVVREQEASLGDWARITQLDTRFHLELARATHNPLVVSMMTSLSRHLTIARATRMDAQVSERDRSDSQPPAVSGRSQP